MRPRLTGLPDPVDRASRLGGLPHLSCKRDEDKMRHYKERRVTPPKSVTSTSWSPPPKGRNTQEIFSMPLVKKVVLLSDIDNELMAKIFLVVAHVNFDVGDVALARDMPNVFASIVKQKSCKQFNMSACSGEKNQLTLLSWQVNDIVNVYPGEPIKLLHAFRKGVRFCD